jgi:nucleoside 2-deoxyribosyltransferase
MDTWKQFLSTWEEKDEKPLVYISGPMVSTGDPYVNIHNAIWAGEYARERGWAVIVPHLDSLVAMVTGIGSAEHYLDNDYNLIDRCDAIMLTTMPPTKESMSGTEREVDFAEFRGIPVYTKDTLPTASDFDKWAEEAAEAGAMERLEAYMDVLREQ